MISFDGVTLRRNKRSKEGGDCWGRYLNNKGKAWKCSKTVDGFERTPLCAPPPQIIAAPMAGSSWQWSWPWSSWQVLHFGLGKAGELFVSCLPPSSHLSARLFLSLHILLPTPFLLAPHFSPPPHVEWLQSLFSSGLAVKLQTHFSLWNEIPAAQEPRTHLNRTRWWQPFHSLYNFFRCCFFFLLYDQLLI